MKVRNIKAVESFLESKDLPTYVAFMKVTIVSYFLLFSVDVFLTWHMLSLTQKDFIQYHTSALQGMLFPGLCFMFTTVFCVVKGKSKVLKVLSWQFFSLAFLIYISVCIQSVMVLAKINSNDSIIFILWFVQMVLFTYLLVLSLIIARMKSVGKKEWNIFDTLMLTVALFAFSSTVFQKVFSVNDMITSIGLVAAAIAFALKFVKLTCDYNALED